MNIAPAGDHAVLLELGEVPAEELHARAAAIRALPGVLACIAGQTSLYVVFDGQPDVEAIRGARAITPAMARANHIIPVSFREEYAPDLPALLGVIGLPRDLFLARLALMPLVVRYIGFRGGFGYLDGWPVEWSMPRRPTSRPRVPAGTFAVAGSVAAFYPIDSPGGWNLLGRTEWNLEHALAAGDRITIAPMFDVLHEPPPRAASPAPSFPFEVRSSPLAQVVTAIDWNRAARGISPGGPFDDVAAAYANRACGNPASAPVLECALTGPRATAARDLVCSWYGADAEITVEGRAIEDRRQFAVREGEEIRAGRITNGLRGYLAAGSGRGEVRPLEREDRLAIRAMAGPHEWRVRELVCEVTPQLDRIGIRMRVISPSGLTAPASLPSCGMQCGTVQLHPDGSLVAMGPDHPVTGGYLQPMTVIASDRWKLAQLAPGERARFTTQFSP